MVAISVCLVVVQTQIDSFLTTALSSVMAATMASWSHRIQFSPQGQLRNLMELVLAGISNDNISPHRLQGVHHVTYLGGQLAQINIKNNFNININAPNCL